MARQFVKRDGTNKIVGAVKWPHADFPEEIDDQDQQYQDFLTRIETPIPPLAPFVIPKDPNPNKPVTHGELSLILDALYAINAARES